MAQYRRGNRNSLMSQYTSNLGSALDRNRAQKAEKAKRAEAERISSITSQFIANMSHELRTPLNSIVGFSDMLSKIEDPQNTNIDVREYGGYINQSANQLLSIINEILDISRIQSDQQSLSLDFFDFHSITDDCIAMLSHQANQKDITLRHSVSNDIPELFLDEVKIRQVLTNIIGNAVKFTPNGGNVSILAQMLNPETLQISIADDGVGMTAEEIGLALTPFGQVVGDLSREFKGTGLGLPIANALVEIHGGSLEVNSEKGKGSIFDVILPIKANNKLNIKH